ncbi:MarR family winged helix-turn-helix transcriptional regulator [Nocardia nova]|uniref:MarR family winged helix-turn-helix transcriptional regulator n=1 Tax=Nocardia nova TaxID=37330 RepID=UPI0033C49496
MKIRAMLAVFAFLAVAGLASACGSGDGAESPRIPSTTAGGPPDNREDQVIGYRLKRVDQLIESTFDRLLGNAGINRRQWQTLNILSRGPQPQVQLADALRPFWEVNNESVAEVVDSLTEHGWARVRPDGIVVLTDEGATAHAAAQREVAKIRDLVAQGISQDEFTQTMDVLRRMTVNLEAVVGR